MLDSRLTKLIGILKDIQAATVAYSGGVDSTFLLKALQLAGVKTTAVTSVSEITPKSDLLTAKAMTAKLGIEHRLIKTDELSKEEFVSNTPQRCFFCKDELFKKLTDITLSEGYMFILDGSQLDDLSDYRPGREAAKKYNVRSPLIEAGLSKNEIRELSRELGLSTWNRPSSSCLATRFPYGQRITKEALIRVDEAEDFLRKLGFHEIRVRDHGSIARIEVREEEIDFVLSQRKIISEKLRSLGYKFIAVDLDGYRSGSMNRLI